MNEDPLNEVEQLSQRLDARLRALERRVDQLERRQERSSSPRNPSLAHALEPSAEPTIPSLPGTGGTLPILGRAVLGIAGAYLLRAMAQLASPLHFAVLALAIVYAMSWLALAGRVRHASWFARPTYALTSALILIPMLWEMTLRFQMFSPVTSACVLGAFALEGLVLTWRCYSATVLWLAYSASLAGSIALMFAAHRVMPFGWVVLGVALASEIAQCMGHRLRGRLLSAIAIDLIISFLIYVYSMPENARPAYPDASIPLLVALASIPFFLYLGSYSIQTLSNTRTITVFEMAQIVLTFFFACYGSMVLSSGRYKVAIGAICIALAAAGYGIAPWRLGDQNHPRNLRAYTTASTAWMLLGCSLALPHAWLAPVLGLAAFIVTLVGGCRSEPILLAQGGALLLAASFFSGLLEFCLHALSGTHPLAPPWIILLVLAFAMLAYAAGARSPQGQTEVAIAQLASASLISATAASFATFFIETAIAHRGGLKLLYTGGLLEFLQTLMLCALSLCLAAIGPRWNKNILTWLAYTTLVMTAAKILLEDALHGHLVFIAASFILYAATLMLLPRLSRPRRKGPALISKLL